MKRINIIFRLVLLLGIACFAATGCKDSDIPDVENPVPDPEGTITLDMHYSKNMITVPGCTGSIYIDKTGFVATEDWLITSIGKVSGLGNITQISGTASYQTSAAIAEKAGYLAVNVDVSRVVYLRLFVNETLNGSISEGIVGYNVKYQYPFNGDAEKLTLSYDESAGIFTVTPDASWSVSSSAAWCPVEVLSKNTFKAVPDESLSAGEREAVITVKSTGLSDVSYTFSLNPELTISQDTVNFTNKSGSESVKINSNSAWTATGNAAWYTIAPLNGDGNNNSLTITVQENSTDENREALITIKASDQYGTTEKRLTIIQEAPDFAGGTGSEANPYRIKTARHLNNLRKYTGSVWQGRYFKLMNDIDLTTFLQNSNAGWAPIPNFYCVLDGDGHIIKNLWMDKTGSAGFFDINNGAIKNMGIEIDPARSVSGTGATGGLAATNKGMLTNCSVKGKAKGADQVGGLTGFNNSGTIQNCHTEVDITGTGNSVYTGGLIGYSSKGSISRSSSKGTVKGSTTNSLYIGGLVGNLSYTDTNNSFSTCGLYAEGSYVYYIGGLIGQVLSSNIQNCYATGEIAGNDAGTIRSGGFVGYSNNSNNYTIINCYFDIETSGKTADGTGGTAVPKTTAGMKQQATYLYWDFSTVWNINEGVSYPYLR